MVVNVYVILILSRLATANPSDSTICLQAAMTNNTADTVAVVPTAIQLSKAIPL